MPKKLSIIPQRSHSNSKQEDLKAECQCTQAFPTSQLTIMEKFNKREAEIAAAAVKEKLNEKVSKDSINVGDSGSTLPK